MEIRLPKHPHGDLREKNFSLNTEYGILDGTFQYKSLATREAVNLRFPIASTGLLMDDSPPLGAVSSIVVTMGEWHETSQLLHSLL